MLAHLKKQKLIVRGLAVVNIVLLVISIFYLCQVVIAEYLDQSHDLHSDKLPKLCWMLWIAVSLVAVVLLPLQLAADALLFKGMHDTLRSIQKYELWVRISNLLLAHTGFGVLLAFFCPLNPTSTLTGGIVLIVLVVVARIAAIYSSYKYKRALESIVAHTTTLCDHGDGTGAEAVKGDGSCRSISPDLLFASNQYDC